MSGITRYLGERLILWRFSKQSGTVTRGLRIEYWLIANEVSSGDLFRLDVLRLCRSSPASSPIVGGVSSPLSVFVPLSSQLVSSKQSDEGELSVGGEQANAVMLFMQKTLLCLFALREDAHTASAHGRQNGKNRQQPSNRQKLLPHSPLPYTAPLPHATAAMHLAQDKPIQPVPVLLFFFLLSPVQRGNR